MGFESTAGGAGEKNYYGPGGWAWWVLEVRGKIDFSQPAASGGEDSIYIPTCGGLAVGTGWCRF